MTPKPKDPHRVILEALPKGSFSRPHHKHTKRATGDKPPFARGAAFDAQLRKVAAARVARPRAGEKGALAGDAQFAKARREERMAALRRRMIEINLRHR